MDIVSTFNPPTPRNVLRLDCSPRATSVSRRLADDFHAALRAGHPDLSVVTRDLAAHPVPHIGRSWTELCDNVLAHGLHDLDRLHEAARTPDQRDAWDILEPYLTELLAADLVVISTPMYNFSVPAALKAWIDQVTFPKMRLGHRRFVVLAARGGTYAPGAPRHAVEHQTRYLSDFIQGHYAVPAPDVITVDLANSSVDPALASSRDEHAGQVRRASAQARALAETLSASWAER